MVFSGHFSKVKLDNNVENGQSKSRKALRKELKKKRQAEGDPATG
jgi:hypothetical protein